MHCAAVSIVTILFINSMYSEVFPTCHCTNARPGTPHAMLWQSWRTVAQGNIPMATPIQTGHDTILVSWSLK
jgi:hypothetical protein